MTAILVAGGGPAGLAAAIALAERCMAVTVVDTNGGVALTRAEMVPQGAREILERLGLADALADSVALEAVVSRWGKAQAQGADPGLGLHGWGLDRRALSKTMIRRARAMGVRILTGRLKDHRRTDTGWHLSVSTMNGPRRVEAAYLIDATGRPARIARRQGTRRLHGPDLVAVVWHRPQRGMRCMQAEAVADGWWYAVPHRQGVSLGFVTSADRAKEVCKAPAAVLESCRGTLDLVSVAGASDTVHAMDCRAARLEQFFGPGWLAVGDAAASFDPISSQGLFNALSGGFFAGQAAADALAGEARAPKVYAGLAARTAERTHAATHLQYAALPFDTDFWRARSGPNHRAPMPMSVAPG